MLPRVKRRRHRIEWVRFLEALRLYVASGFEIHYAWREALRRLKTPTIPRTLESTATESAPEFQLWLQILTETVRQGASLTEVLVAFRGALKQEIRRDWEQFLKSLPIRVNIVLLLFFFPAFFCLLFLPLVMILVN